MYNSIPVTNYGILPGSIFFGLGVLKNSKAIPQCSVRLDESAEIPREARHFPRCARDCTKIDGPASERTYARTLRTRGFNRKAGGMWGRVTLADVFLAWYGLDDDAIPEFVNEG